MLCVSPESSYSAASSRGGRINVLEGISTSQFNSSLISRGLIVRDGDLVDNNKLLG